MKQDRLKTIISEMSEYIYNGYVFPVELLVEMHEIYCSTCGSCGKLECCPPNKCKFGVNYIDNLRKELSSTRKALGTYIGMRGYNVTEEVINQEIEFYGK